MKNFFLALVLGLGVSESWAQAGSGAGNAGQGSNIVPSQAGALRVNSPQANQQIAQSFVHVNYQLVNPGVAAAPSPNFTIQLDGTNPITTTGFDYTLTRLAPGPHAVTVTLVDANGAPIADSSVAVKFTVSDGQRTGGTASLFHSKPNPRLTVGKSEVATPLPMLSLVGFAVLVGGIVTALRNR